MNKVLVAGAVLTAALSSAYVMAANGERRANANKQLIEQGIRNGSITVPAAGGTCGAPTAFSAVPYNDTGTTVGATNIVGSLQSGCSNYTTVAGPDVVYSFVAGTGANLTFTVTPEDPDYDPAIYLLSTCATGTGASCINGSDAYYYGEAETFSVSTLAAGTTYYLHVDSFYSTTGGGAAYASGPYSLNVTGTLPVQLQSFEIN